MKMVGFRMLFEQIGLRIGALGQRIVSRNRKKTENARLARTIADNEERMAKLFWELGQTYYLKHRREESCGEQELVDRINVLFTENLQCRQKIKKNNCVTVCRICGSQLAEGALFCTGCGAGLSDAEAEFCKAEESGEKCPDCGTPIKGEGSYCTFCGKKTN